MAVLKANLSQISSIHDELKTIYTDIYDCMDNIQKNSLLSKVDTNSSMICNVYDVKDDLQLMTPTDLLPDDTEYHDYTVDADAYNTSADSIYGEIDRLANSLLKIGTVVDALESIEEAIVNFDTTEDLKLKDFNKSYDDTLYADLYAYGISVVEGGGSNPYPDMVGIKVNEIVKPEVPEVPEEPEEPEKPEEPEEPEKPTLPVVPEETPPGPGPDDDPENGGTGEEPEGGEEEEEEPEGGETGDITKPEDKEPTDGEDGLPKVNPDETPSGTPEDGKKPEDTDGDEEDITDMDTVENPNGTDGDETDGTEVNPFASDENPEGTDGENGNSTDVKPFSEGENPNGTDGENGNSVDINGVTPGENPNGTDGENGNPFDIDETKKKNPKDDMGAFLGLNGPPVGGVVPGVTDDPYDLSEFDPTNPNVVTLKNIYNEYNEDDLNRLGLDPSVLKQMVRDGRNPNLALVNAISGLAVGTVGAGIDEDDTEKKKVGKLKDTLADARRGSEDGEGIGTSGILSGVLKDAETGSEESTISEKVVKAINSRLKTSLVLTAMGVISLFAGYLFGGIGLVSPFVFVVAGAITIALAVAYGFNRYLSHLVDLVNLKDKMKIFENIKQNMKDALVLAGVGLVSAFVTFVLGTLGIVNPICFGIAGLFTIVMTVIAAFNKYLSEILDVEGLINDSILSEANKELLRKFFKSKNGFNLKILVLLLILLFTFILKLFGKISWLWLLILLLLILLLILLVALSLKNDDEKESKEN